jgi:hypothetical protein
VGKWPTWTTFAACGREKGLKRPVLSQISPFSSDIEHTTAGHLFFKNGHLATFFGHEPRNLDRNAHKISE